MSRSDNTDRLEIEARTWTKSTVPTRNGMKYRRDSKSEANASKRSADRQACHEALRATDHESIERQPVRADKRGVDYSHI